MTHYLQASLKFDFEHESWEELAFIITKNERQPLRIKYKDFDLQLYVMKIQLEINFFYNLAVRRHVQEKKRNRIGPKM